MRNKTNNWFKALSSGKKLGVGLGLGAVFVIASSIVGSSPSQQNIQKPSADTPSQTQTITVKTETPANKVETSTPETKPDTTPTPAAPSKPAVTTPTPAPKQAPAQNTSNCDPNYTPCIPYVAGNTLNCPDIKKRVHVIGDDHNKFDADHDGYGCESYN